MKFDEAFFDQIIDRRNTDCEKWDDRSVMDADGVPLWVADMDFACAPAIVEAIQQRADHPCFGYTIENPADNEALIGFWKRRHGLEIQPGEIQMLPCVITGLKTCVRAFTQPGDSVAIVTPVYGPFYGSIQSNGRVVRAVSLLRDEETGRYELDFGAMQKALREGAKLMMLCSPHNPVSRLWTKEELTRLCELAEEYGVPIVCDEIHADFVYPPQRFVSILSIPEGRNRAVMLCSASKTFNVAGLQQAALVCMNPDMLEKLRRELNAAGVACGNTFALLAARAAYTACDDWLDGLIAYLDGSRKLLSDWVAEYVPKAKMSPVEATYLAWLDLKAYGLSCAELAKKFRKAKVALTGGTFFGEEGEGFMRVNFACPRSQLKEGIKRLGAALEEG
ncbi:MAG: pyridoxal phosphate-dependent aminotransferase [Clostridia bacterium]|nr:pyridoxal phosphate-dependent aminotransferase [Clostridia bacterium]MBR0228622.1 pyridoxal phosphate-dependent aminotransferase [Clostridia bacterium]